MAGFDTLGNTFLSQIKCIPNRRSEAYNTVCQILKDSDLGMVRDSIIADEQFCSVALDISHKIIDSEMEKVMANKKLKMGAEKMDPDVFANFSFVIVNKEHDKDASFTQLLLQTCVDANINEILLNLDIESSGELPTLHDNMKKPLLLAEKMDSMRNQAFVAIVCMGMLCYA